MIYFTRHVGESVIIGDSTVITVVEIRDDKVRLGVDAPIAGDISRAEPKPAKEGRKGTK